mgnify:CR=1 FL=1
MRADLTDCRPLRDDLPPGTTGAIQCRADDPNVALVGFYLFDGTVDMRAAYEARMTAEGVKRNTSACVEGEGEGPYVPGEGEIGPRGCAAFLSEPRFEKLPALFEGPGANGHAPEKVDVESMKALRKQLILPIFSPNLSIK